MLRAARPFTKLVRTTLLAGAVAVAFALMLPPARAHSVASSTTRLDWGSKAPLPTRRVGLGVVAAPNGKLYAIGGGMPALTRRVEEYNPATNTWRGATHGLQAMPTPRDLHGAALAPDGQIYVMGGIYPFCSSGPVCTRVEAYNPDANTWATKQAMPTPRQYFGLATAPNGNLHAVGGYLGSGDPALRHRGEVFEYDHLANAWTTRAPMPTPRRAMSVAMVGDRIFAIGGFNGAPLDIVEEAVLDHLPTVGAGGPYSAGASTTVQLNATASDPDGDAFSFAWDVDGDLVYETPGQPRPISNARVDILGGPSNITAAQDVPVSGAQVVFTVARQPADQTPVMVPFQVIDACTPALPWSSFVGFGAGY